MILLGYSSPKTATQIASQIASASKKANGEKQADGAIGVELVIRTDSDGGRHVADPKLGVAAFVRRGSIGWGGLVLVVGFIGDLVQGDSVLDDAGIVDGIVWGLLGIFAGALYGVWAGRSVSARTLKSVGPLLAPESSMVLAWAGEPVARASVDGFTKPDSQRLVVRFNTVEHGAILEAA